MYDFLLETKDSYIKVAEKIKSLADMSFKSYFQNFKRTALITLWPASENSETTVKTEISSFHFGRTISRCFQETANGGSLMFDVA